MTSTLIDEHWTNMYLCALVNSCQQRVSKTISVGVAELGEFCFVSYHLILDSNLFTCYVKGLVRQEDYGMLLFHILSFLLCGDCTLGIAELCEFCFVCYHLILDSNLLTCCLSGLVRREADNISFFCILRFLLCGAIIWGGRTR